MAIEVSGSQRDLQPYSDIGIIWVTFPDGFQARGTASLIGRNDILTATHVVYDPDHGGWADDMDFYFGADYNDITREFEDVGYKYEPSKWEINGWPDQTFTDSDNATMIRSEAQYDIALIGVNSPIGDDLGWLGLDSRFDGSYLADTIGYPVGQTGMMQESVFVHEGSFSDIYESNSDVLGSGSSGGPLLIGDFVIGVKSTGSWWADIGFVYEQLIDVMDENNSLLSLPPPLPDTDDLPNNPVDGELDSPMRLTSGKSGDNTSFSGGNNIDTLVYEIPYSQVSSVAQSKDGSWAVKYNFTSTNGSKDGNTNGSKVTDTLHEIERLNFSDGTNVALDIASPNQVSGAALALLYAGFNSIPDTITFGHWIAKADQINDHPVFDDSKIESLAQTMLTEFIPEGISNSDLVSALYTNVVGEFPDQNDVNFYTQLIDNGTHSQASLFALAAESNLNIDKYATLIGSGLQYEPEQGKLG